MKFLSFSDMLYSKNGVSTGTNRKDETRYCKFRLYILLYQAIKLSEIY